MPTIGISDDAGSATNVLGLDHRANDADRYSGSHKQNNNENKEMEIRKTP